MLQVTPYVVYTKRMLKKQFPERQFYVIGEVGNLSRANHFSLIKSLHGDLEIKVFPVDTHIPFFDQKIGYVLLSEECLAALYKPRFTMTFHRLFTR